MPNECIVCRTLKSNFNEEHIFPKTIGGGFKIYSICSDSNEDKAKFAELNTGINQFGHFVYVGKFGILEAQVASAKAAYLAAIVLSDYKEDLLKFNAAIPLVEYMITNTGYNFLNKLLKFVAQGEALFYWFQTIRLLHLE